jgi:cholesterol oxidase
MPTEEWDVIIIGSGFGGSVCALRAAKAGLRTLVLERGDAYPPAAYDEMARGTRPLISRRHRPAIIKIHKMRSLIAVTGCGVGGGSHAYTAVTMPARDELFSQGWPASINASYMREYYRRVEEIIAPSPTPVELPRMVAMKQAASKIGVEAVRLSLAMDWPGDPSTMTRKPPACGIRDGFVRWLRGGGASKRTLDKTYLRLAMQAGAVIRPLHEACCVEPIESGHRVHCRRSASGYVSKVTVFARRVILAAGTLATNRILLECRDKYGTLPRISATLGARFFTNGDLGAMLLGVTSPFHDDGPPVTTWLDLWNRDRMFLMEQGGLRQLAGVPRAAWCFVVMGLSDAPGSLQLDRSERLIHRPVRDDRDYTDRAYRRLRELAKVMPAMLIAPPRRLNDWAPITVHPLGGAAMADSPERGVVNPLGEVFNYPGLYIVDGSILPTPTGVPPSMTIAALAEHVMDHMVRA